MRNALTHRAYCFFKYLAVCLFISIAALPLTAAERPEWSSVEAPEIVSIEADESGKILVVSFNLVTATEGADKASVEMKDSAGQIITTKNIGKSKKLLKTAKFEPQESGDYYFTVKAIRNKESTTIDSETVLYHFSYPLAAPEISARNLGEASVEISWKEVHEATGYSLSITDNKTGKTVVEKDFAATDGKVKTGCSFTAEKLEADKKYTIKIAALRESTNEEKYSSIRKTARKEADRSWNFSWFGQSTGGSKNTMEMLDADELKFKLNSCTYNESTLDIIDKGGKFTAFHDGISYYYTVVDPEKENFELTATFTIDYINNPADGQEGFGLLAMDSLGSYGVTSENHYTNSAGIIATKFEENIGGVKKSSKDTLGARFVTGITPEILAEGETAIAEKGKSLSRAYSYDQSDLVRIGDVYRITLKKTNTGYHCIYTRPNVGEDTIEEFILYGPEKLLQLDKDHLYVGFAVARGCNVTVSDISFKITSPENDPPPQEEPPELVPLTTKIDSPSSYHTTKYPFVFCANADGKLSVKNAKNAYILQDKAVYANKDFTAEFTLKKGINDYTVIFTPDPAYKPGEHMAMAWYDKENKVYLQGAKPVTTAFFVACNYYDGDTLYVSPEGDAFGKGTKERPLDLASAIAYAKPGQTILLEGGSYKMQKALIIPRGNNGTATAPKVLKSAEGARAVLDFTIAGGGFQLWGDWWQIENIDICRTGDNIKGLQVAGDHNLIRQVDTYLCGDTGCQISGRSDEPFEKWPSFNLVESCTSWGNCDPAENNADGFAAKLTCGEGNVFRGCIAYNNIDDGWDLFAKAETGKIGIVTIEGCVAYRNGFLPDGSGNGDGNGFKLGGDGIGIAHLLKNSIAYENGATGITSNSNPDVVLEKVTSYGNSLRNIALYGKGKAPRNFKAKGVLSINGAESDNFEEQPELASEDNYFWTGACAENKSGQKLKQDIFISIDTKIIPEHKGNGSIDMKSLLEIKDTLQKDIGARF